MDFNILDTTLLLGNIPCAKLIRNYIRDLRDCVDVIKHDDNYVESNHIPGLPHKYTLLCLTCFRVICGFQSFFLSIRDKATVPDGKTLGWNNAGSKMPAKRDISFYTII